MALTLPFSGLQLRSLIKQNGASDRHGGAPRHRGRCAASRDGRDGRTA
jgi:hypothetical protein